MGTQLPFLPVHSREEFKLFGDLILQGYTDEHEMAVKWCEWVDGKMMFPKLPGIFGRTENDGRKIERKWDAVKKAKDGIELLTQLNVALCPKSDVVETLHVNLDDDLEFG
jgi:hypothetical protein